MSAELETLKIFIGSLENERTALMHKKFEAVRYFDGQIDSLGKTATRLHFVVDELEGK